MKLFTLRTLLIAAIITTLIGTTVISVSSSYIMQKETLVENTLERNFAYAQKLASSAELSIYDAQKMLAESANTLATQFTNTDALHAETSRLLNQSSTFNSISIVDANGKVVAVSPPMRDIVGQQVQSIGAEEALRTKKPTISEPYEAMTGRLVITLTYPIFDASSHYAGYISGAIYLREKNIFSTLMEIHFSQDDSYVYVVDQNGTIIYHQDELRIRDNVIENEVVQTVLAGENGAMKVKNTKGIDMLAGYSFVEGANWGIVSQRSFHATVMPAREIVWKNSLLSLPLMLIVLVAFILFATKIAKPMHQLTTLTNHNVNEQSIEQLRHINGWYVEAQELKTTLINTFSALQNEVDVFKNKAMHDELTTLLNRRAVTSTLQSWDDSNTPYALILFDIDKFKAVNDTYGHQVGDDVLIFFAQKLKQHTMPYHLCCRYGGEEFIILLPNTDTDEAFILANAIREHIASVASPTSMPITVSGGVASSVTHSSYKEVIEQADAALYAAKENGRNRIFTTAST